MLQRFVGSLALVSILAACEQGTPQPITPSYALSAPTLEASPVLYPVVPQGEPTDFIAPGQNNPTAAALPSGGELPPLPVGSPQVSGAQTIEITAPDGTPLGGDLVQDPLGDRNPAVILLSTNRAGWGDLPLRIERAGFTVLSMDARANADSSVALGDVGAIITALARLPSVDASRVALIGTEEAADLVLAACGGGQPCDAMALFSPQTAAQQAIFAFNPRPLFLAVGQQAADFIVTESLRAAAQGEVSYHSVPTDESGMALLNADTNLEAALIEWLQDALLS